MLLSPIAKWSTSLEYFLGLSFDVVTKLAADFLEKKHHIYADKYFISYQLAKHLLKNGTYLNGTINTNRKNLPYSIKTLAEWTEGKL